MTYYGILIVSFIRLSVDGSKHVKLKDCNVQNLTPVINVLSKIPVCVLEVETEIRGVCALLSKTSTELNRLKTNGRLTRRTKRNQIEISKGCSAIISNCSLVCNTEKLKRLHYLSKKRKTENKSEKARKLNEQFEKDPKSISQKFKKCIVEDEEDLNHIFVEKLTERRFFEDPKVVETFWRNLCEKAEW